MAVDHQLVQFFQSVSVETFQKIDALGYSREGTAVTGQNKINVQITYLVQACQEFP